MGYFFLYVYLLSFFYILMPFLFLQGSVLHLQRDGGYGAHWDPHALRYWSTNSRSHTDFPTINPLTELCSDIPSAVWSEGTSEAPWATRQTGSESERRTATAGSSDLCTAATFTTSSTGQQTESGEGSVPTANHCLLPHVNLQHCHSHARVFLYLTA